DPLHTPAAEGGFFSRLSGCSACEESGGKNLPFLKNLLACPVAGRQDKAGRREAHVTSCIVRFQPFAKFRTTAGGGFGTCSAPRSHECPWPSSSRTGSGNRRTGASAI